ncbi:MAG: NYN domain-containing protein, partial [Acidobacteria bacterium]|nr:NYN domain-containing protein [Acidobacteriota bacterium]
MNVTDTRSTRIAVFIDFDNVEIGVKTTIGGQFDIGLVLEAIKERGEIVTKIAYSDWKRAGDYSRLLTQHAIRMVQRNLTPGGDKNGADITMALDALEMAFTHDHINAFVIVGGDSDFISLVEKLKQYGRKVIVVGGRQFTSATMQKNCHEFIAYENLVGSSRGGRSAERGGRPASGGAQIAQALPLVRRALKVLSEREVTPQLGLLKSTLLQLDSTFSERNYGASSFRDFMEKVAETGAVTLKQAGRSMLVEQHAAACLLERHGAGLG